MFENFIVTKHANSSKIGREEDNSRLNNKPPSKSLEGQLQGYHNHPKVYQHCDNCKVRTIHVIIKDKVMCGCCKIEYKLLDKKTTRFDFERI